MLPAVPLRVLVVDDDLGVRHMLHDTLHAADYDVEATGTAAAGLTAARSSKPDVILLDVGLPGVLTGDVAMPVFKNFAPVIIISGSADNALLGRLLEEGAFGYMRKPFNLQQLVDMVNAAVRSGGVPADAIA